MSGRPDIQCREPGCPKRTPTWRQCPRQSCALDIGYCEDHGGGEREVQEMAEHIRVETGS